MADAAATGRRLGQILALYESGQYLQAWEASRALGPLERWTGPDGMALAGRLAYQLGAPALGARLHLAARRRHPESGEAWMWAMRAAANRLGPYATLALLRQGGPPGAPEADALGLRAMLAAVLRDFDEAERCLDRAEALAPGDPFLPVQRSEVMERADDRDGALREVDRALVMRPWFRPAVDQRADLLVQLGREDEAEAWLEDALLRIEAGSTAAALLRLQLDRERYREAAVTLARLEALTPRRARSFERWLDTHRSEIAYHLGDLTAAAAHARRSEVPFHVALADRLEAPARGSARRVHPVPFVRQHHMTCAPATLSALSAFHGVPAAHLEIAEAICYDGTPAHAERRWAEERGFAVREFTVSWDAARALVDLGLPFTLTSVEPRNAHLQALVGYDEARGTLLLRDPTIRPIVEITAGWLEEHRASGPRGMVVAPAAAALEGVALPDAPLHDRYHGLQAALVAHRREEAAGHAAALAEAAPDHLLTLWGARSVAAYDGRPEGELQATEALLRRFPDDVNLRLDRQGLLARLGRRQEQIEWLRAERSRQPHVLLDGALADALAGDARCGAEALGLLRRLVRRRPEDALGYHLLGDVLWERGVQEEAIRAYRVAACLAPADEHFAFGYFAAARWLRRTDEALAFLRGRFERSGRKAPWPAFTLADALEALGRDEEALAALEQALVWRPDDGELLLRAARAFASNGQGTRAAELLERARGVAGEQDLRRAEAVLAELRGDLPAAAEAQRRLVALAPLDVGAVETAARLLAETGGREAALEFLRAHAARFPHHRGLGQALAGWLEDGSEEREAALRRLLEADPDDAWAHRELALHLAGTGRPAEAMEALERGAAVDPDSTSTHNVRAILLADAGHLEEARASLRTSLRLAVDQRFAMRRLLELAPDGAARSAELRFVRDELVRQVTFGDGLLAFEDQARGLLTPAEVHATLRDGHAARPDLWHAWVALARHQASVGRLDEARALLGEAVRRFPLLPRAWLELGEVERVRGQAGAAREAFEGALAIAPGWRQPALRLAESLHGEGRYEEERALLARALRHAPSDAVLHGNLADALLGLGREEEALEELRRAVRLDPGYGWALSTLRDLGQPEAARALGQELVTARPHDPRAWLVAARTAATTEEALGALDRARAVAPRHLEAALLRLAVLADAGRHDEARAVAGDPAWNGRPPRELRLEVARLEARLERLDAALAALAPLLSDEPDFLEGWEQAVTWNADASRGDAALSAARRVAALAPGRALTHGYLAIGHLAAGRRREALAELEGALDLEPDFPWAIQRLADLRLEDRAPDQAARLLPLADLHLAPAEAALLRLRVAAARGREPEAVAALAALLAQGATEQVEAAVEALHAARFRAGVAAALEAGLASPGTEAAGRAWLAWWRRRASGAGLEGKVREALRRTGSPAARTALALGWLRLLTEWNHREKVLASVPLLRPIAEEEVRVWGEVGRALVHVGEPAGAVRWLEGWRGRAAVKAWMVFNGALAQADLGDLEGASATAREVLEALPGDHTAALLGALAAAGPALRGDLAAVRALPAASDVMPALYQAVRALLLALEAAEAAGPRGAWKAARPLLARAAAERRPALVHLARRVREEVARRQPGAWYRFVAWLESWTGPQARSLDWPVVRPPDGRRSSLK